MENKEHGERFWDDILSGNSREVIDKLAGMATRTRLETGDLYRIREHQVAREIRAQRIASDLSQADLAKRMGELGFQMEQSTIAKIENGKRPLRLAELFALSAILNVPEVAFLESSVGDEVEQHDGYIDELRQLLQTEIDQRERIQSIMKNSLESSVRMLADAEASIRWTSGQIRVAVANAMKDERGDESEAGDAKED